MPLDRLWFDPAEVFIGGSLLGAGGGLTVEESPAAAEIGEIRLRIKRSAGDSLE